MKIFLDMDGVLVNAMEGFFSLFGAHYQEELYPPGLWDVHRYFGVGAEEFWHKIPNGFWDKLKPYSWAPQLINAARVLGKTYFVTSPTRASRCAMEKLQFLYYHTWTTAERGEFIITPHKHLLASTTAVLIDDYDRNCERFREAGGRAILFPQKWNSAGTDALLQRRVEHTLAQLDAM